MPPDLPCAQALSAEIEAILPTVPGRYQDPDGHAGGADRIRRAVWAVDENAIVEEGRLRAFGITSTSTGGFHSTCRNWISRVRTLAGIATHAPAAGGGK